MRSIKYRKYLFKFMKPNQIRFFARLPSGNKSAINPKIELDLKLKSIIEKDKKAKNVKKPKKDIIISQFDVLDESTKIKDTIKNDDIDKYQEILNSKKDENQTVKEFIESKQKLVEEIYRVNKKVFFFFC